MVSWNKTSIRQLHIENKNMKWTTLVGVKNSYNWRVESSIEMNQKEFLAQYFPSIALYKPSTWNVPELVCMIISLGRPLGTLYKI